MILSSLLPYQFPHNQLLIKWVFMWFSKTTKNQQQKSQLCIKRLILIIGWNKWRNNSTVKNISSNFMCWPSKRISMISKTQKKANYSQKYDKKRNRYFCWNWALKNRNGRINFNWCSGLVRGFKRNGIVSGLRDPFGFQNAGLQVEKSLNESWSISIIRPMIKISLYPQNKIITKHTPKKCSKIVHSLSSFDTTKQSENNPKK